MANPVISGVQVLYPNGQTNLRPGQSATVIVEANDGDNRSVTVDITVTDADGNIGSTSTVVGVSDPLTYSATTTSGTITPVAGQPGRFTLTA